ncbi:MAG: transglutaminase-like domain-containing protein [Acidobacteriota bacterium]
MRRLWVLLLVVSSRLSGADEAQILLPRELAAGLGAGPQAGATVSAEPGGDGLLVSVSQALRALETAPGYPLADAAACGDPSALEVPAGFQTPAELASLRSGSSYAYDVLVGVVRFVSLRVVAAPEDRGPQDAESVLRRGLGRCSGRTNLAVGLLRSLGIPARGVHGVVVGEAGAQWHRWGEAWLGALGWMPFDPGTAVGAVSVRYLPLSGAGSRRSLDGVRLLGLDENGYLGLPVRDGLRVLPAHGVAVRFVAPDGGRQLVATLRGPGGWLLARRSAGEVSFSRLLPGRYSLAWSEDGCSWSVGEVDLGGASELSLDLGRFDRARRIKPGREPELAGGFSPGSGPVEHPGVRPGAPSGCRARSQT